MKELCQSYALKMKTIIIEGINGSGKSILCKELSLYYHSIIKHGGTAPVTLYDLANRCHRQYLYAKEGDYILDRVCAISHLVYENRPHFKSLNTFLRHQIKELSELCIIIHCTGKGKPVFKSYYTEELKERVIKESEVLRELYKELFNSIHHIEYNFNTMKIEDIICKI